MKKILFRGKRLDNGEWVEGFYCKHDMVQVCFSSDDPKTKHLIIQDGFCDWGFEPPLCGIEIAPETVGQFTGLTDINDNKIFEGDIVRDNWDKIYKIFYTTVSCSFMAQCTFAPNDNAIGNYRIGEAWLKTIEVIGNIHDNSELLEGEV